MRLEDKELEGPDLEREQRLEVLEDQTEEHDHELPEHAGPEVVDAELAHRSRLFDALQAILAGENLSIPMLYLPQREERALEALQAAVSGRDRSMNTFVFAEDRASLLEQALAVLQQNLTRGDAETLAVLHARYDVLTTNVAELRDQLLGLEDAQDDLIEQKPIEREGSGDAPDTTDEDASSEPGFLASALNEIEKKELRSTLVGPDLPEAPKVASTLDGPERPVETKATSLTGADLPEPAPHKSALDASGPEVPNKSDHVSMLDGPERPGLEGAKRSGIYIEADDVSAREVPHLRPRVAAHQPTGMKLDGTFDNAKVEERELDDPRGPAPPATVEELKKAQGDTAKSSNAADEAPSRPTPKPRGLSARTTEKPNKK